MPVKLGMEGLQVGKEFLQGGEMSEVALVDEAAGWAKRLTQQEARGPGDIENAWRRLESRYAIPWRTFWALRYRKPRDLTAAIYQRLKIAYESECERQLRRLEHELEVTRKTAPSHRYVQQVEALVGEVDEQD